MKDLMNSKLFLKNNMLCCAAYNCSNSSKNHPGKTLFILSKNECTRKAWIAAINRNEGALRKNVYLCSDHFKQACFDKSWAEQTQLFYKSRPKKTKLVDGSIVAVI